MSLDLIMNGLIYSRIVVLPTWEGTLLLRNQDVIDISGPYKNRNILLSPLVCYSLILYSDISSSWFVWIIGSDIFIQVNSENYFKWYWTSNSCDVHMCSKPSVRENLKTACMKTYSIFQSSYLHQRTHVCWLS